MDDILDDIVRAAIRCERTARAFDADPLATEIKKLYNAVSSVEKAWSGSWIGYHAFLYINGLRPKRPDEFFNPEWGFQSVYFTSPGDWQEYDNEEIEEEILARAELENTSSIIQAAKDASDAFEQSKGELLPTLDALLSEREDTVLRGIRTELVQLESHISRSRLAQARAPRNFSSRDSLAMTQAFQGLKPPPHLRFQFWLIEQESYGKQAAELAKIARHVERYLRQTLKMKGRTMAKTEGRIFIGHGHSGVWKDLRDFLQNRLKLEWEEFNRESTAGIATKDRLEAMLDNSCFAFLVMTAEDEHADDTKHARENVIHEAGMFQGRLGFQRAIILLEEECTEFSNIHGIGQIRFPKGSISAKYEEIRQVLERENIIP